MVKQGVERWKTYQAQGSFLSLFSSSSCFLRLKKICPPWLAVFPFFSKLPKSPPFPRLSPTFLFLHQPAWLPPTTLMGSHTFGQLPTSQLMHGVGPPFFHKCNEKEPQIILVGPLTSKRVYIYSRMKISIITDISVLRFYEYIGYISDISKIYRRIF